MQTMKLKNFDHLNCSLAQTLSVIGEHWTLLVIRDVFMGLRRFDEIQKDLDIARNVLSQRLKRLVAEDILEKSRGESGFNEYRLTQKGLALQPILLSMTHWGDKYKPNPKGKRLTFIDRQDGRPIQPMSVRAQDGRKLKPKDVKIKRGPGYKSSRLDVPLTALLARTSNSFRQ